MASRVDLLYFYLLSVSAFFTLGIWAVVVFYAVRYRRSKHPVAVPIEGSTKLELTWTVIPLLISLTMFGWGASIFFAMNRPPHGAL